MATCATSCRRKARSTRSSKFAMRWEVIDKNRKHVDAIARAVKKADALYLSTDPDREGEAISWHLYEMLKESGALDGKSVHRSVFYEITKNAVQEAVDQPREISEELVKAYLARRALDYLVGFNLSPLLWKKAGLSGASAGRVQSPALRMICEREEEIAAFVAREYWTIDAEAEKDDAGLRRAADRVRRREGRAVHRDQRAAGRRRAPHARAGRGRHAHGREGREASSASATPRRRSRPPRCSRRRRASSASAPSARCASRSGCTKASTSARARSASSPTCAPTR